jgi:hypothetical protein
MQTGTRGYQRLRLCIARPLGRSILRDLGGRDRRGPCNIVAGLIGVAVSLLGAWPGAAQEPRLVADRERVETQLGHVIRRMYPLSPAVPGTGRVFAQPVAEPNATGLRFHFAVSAQTPKPTWAIRIADQNDRTVWTYVAPEVPSNDFWSDETPSGNATVELYSVDEGNVPRIAIDRLVAMTPPVKPRAITEPDDRLPIGTQSTLLQERGRSVARIRFVGDDGVAYVCTGFLVASDLLITNQHCIRNEAEMRSGLADFDFDNVTAKPVTFRFRSLVLTNPSLDYTLLRIRGAPKRAPLAIRAVAPEKDQTLVIIQHPGGEPKQVSIAGCLVKDTKIAGIGGAATDFGHLCDTLGGSSGSPVQDERTGDVIGLHHLGFLPDSVLPVNQAVTIGLVLQDIDRRAPSVGREIRPPVTRPTPRKSR